MTKLKLSKKNNFMISFNKKQHPFNITQLTTVVPVSEALALSG